ncbi:hypothetical protein ACFX11_030613 [Malus domestica]
MSARKLRPYFQAHFIIVLTNHPLQQILLKRIDIFSDSQLVVNQVTNNFDANDSSMVAYLAQTQLLLKHFHYQITQIPRATNSHADALARLASTVEYKIGRKI